MFIDFEVLNKNPLEDYRLACSITRGVVYQTEKPQLDTVEWWVKQIVANHSTLRCVRFRMMATAKRPVVMQLIRATKGHPQPEVQSSRPDWTGKSRSRDPNELISFMQDHTAESFIEMAKQRLCSRTEADTRIFMREAVMNLKTSDVPFLKAVGSCCKPSCFWLGACPELKPCSDTKQRLFTRFIEHIEE